jgi:hypothetical protein
LIAWEGMATGKSKATFSQKRKKMLLEMELVK